MALPAPSALPEAWHGLVDDAAIFPPGNAPLLEAVAAHTERRGAPYADLVGAFLLRDTDLPLVRGTTARLAIVSTGGAGQVAGALGLVATLGLRVTGLEIALRDLDDLAGNARRVVAAVDAARSGGSLEEGITVAVELPQGSPSPGWLAAADEVAAAELRLKFRTGGVESAAFPDAATLAAWIDAALERETPFKCTAGLHHAVRHRDAETGFEHHGFLNLLTATEAAFDGAPAEDVAALLDQQDAAAVVGALDSGDVGRARRWFTSFGSCSVTDPLDDLRHLGVLP